MITLSKEDYQKLLSYVTQLPWIEAEPIMKFLLEIENKQA